MAMATRVTGEEEGDVGKGDGEGNEQMTTRRQRDDNEMTTRRRRGWIQSKIQGNQNNRFRQIEHYVFLLISWYENFS
jgi:hypothetical protein